MMKIPRQVENVANNIVVEKKKKKKATLNIFEVLLFHAMVCCFHSLTL